ncbi:MAG: peptidase M61 [Ignavibacteria bacterium]
MQKIFLLIFLSIFTNLYSQDLKPIIQDDTYQFFVDLNNVVDDRLEVRLITPKINSEKIQYKFPAMVPGTYKIYNFGRFVTELKATDNAGLELPVEKIDVNTWEISNANNLYQIKYLTDDTYGQTDNNAIFEPVGTSIEKDTVFVINNQGFFGYFSEYITNDYILSFTKPSGFYGSTSLNAISRTDNEEIFTAPDYQYAVDSPIMFNIPDTTTIKFDEANISVSVYSPGKAITSADISVKLKTLLNAIRNFLGGKLPADKYTFIYYFSNTEGSGSFGALEHNYSSFYYMPDVPKEAAPYILNQLQSTNAHEFYHIVTPLNLHSEEIGNFDFNNPKMSKHLWLYEGVTEYHADYIQLREGLKDLKEYVKAIEGKMNSSSKFNDTLAFTELSKGALDEHSGQYSNVYEKGALIGLCLDILIREESNGTQGLQDVLNKLSEKYGEERSFKDDDLIDEISILSSPKVGEFLNRYVAGSTRIPYDEILKKIGIKVESTPYEVISLGGGLQIGFNQKTYRLKINSVDNSDSKFIKELGIEKGDELVSINGTELSYLNFKDAFGSVKNKIKKGDNFEIVVARMDGNGVEKKEKLKAKVSETRVAYENDVTILDKITEAQKKLRDAWKGNL